MVRGKESPKKSVKKVKKNDSESESNTFIFIMKEDNLKNLEKGKSTDLITLRHPGSDQTALFLYNSEDSVIQEVLVFHEKYRSWFIDDNVASNGKLYLSTPVDPIFLVLPYLMKSEQFQPLDQCLWDKDYPETARLVHCQNLDLSLISDFKGDESLSAYKYNETKTLSWLEGKIEKVVKFFKAKGTHVSQGAVSANFIKSGQKQTEEEYLKYAHGIVSEYLTDELSKKLAKHLNIPEEVENKKRKINSPDDKINEKRSKKDIPMDQEEFTITENKTKAQKSLTKKELARQKAAAGSKSITSFFTKK